MKIFLRIIFLILSGILLFYYLGRDFPGISGNLIKEEVHTNQNLCFQNPDIEFFMYHYIRDYDIKDSPSTKNLSITPALFDAQMIEVESLAKKKKIYLMQGNDFLNALDSGCFPGKDIWIFTADDGWIDTKDYLIPIASHHNVPFFLGIITSKLDVSGFLSKIDVQNLSKNPLITISSHSMSHTDNSKLSKEMETTEMCNSREILKRLTGQRVETYIYPSGRINPTIDEDIAKNCGYKLAWSTSFGTNYNSHTGSIYDLNRVRIQGDTDPHFFDVLLEKIGKKELNKK